MADSNKDGGDQITPEPDVKPKFSMNWLKVLFHIHLHLCALYGILMVFKYSFYSTILFAAFLYFLGFMGITVGAHRLWAHASYTASTSLKVFLIFCQTLVCQGPVYDWVLDHRIHHKYHGTDKDPYNFNKGFFFSHFSSKCIDMEGYDELAKTIDMSDLEEDSVVMYQKRLYWFVMPIVSLLLPINFVVEYLGDSFVSAIFVVGLLRIVLLINAAWFTHSQTLIFGVDPLDKKSAETSLVFFVNKSMWPRYHYLLPWDYQVQEFGGYGDGMSTTLIRILAVLGLAKDLVTISSQGVKDALAKAVEDKLPVIECLNKYKTHQRVVDLINAADF